MDDLASALHGHATLGTDMPVGLRAACMSAGDWALLAAAEVDRVLTQTRNRRPEAFAEGLRDLAARGAITAADASHLQEMVKHLFGAVRGKTEPGAGLAGVMGCYRALCAARETSPAALAIASTAVRVMQGYGVPASLAAERTAAAVNTGAAVGFGVGGAIIGAGIGAGFGPIGAGLGALIGGAVGAGASISNDKGV